LLRGYCLGLAAEGVGWPVVTICCPCPAVNVGTGWFADHGCRINPRLLLLVFWFFYESIISSALF